MLVFCALQHFNPQGIIILTSSLFSFLILSLKLDTQRVFEKFIFGPFSKERNEFFWFIFLGHYILQGSKNITCLIVKSESCTGTETCKKAVSLVTLDLHGQCKVDIFFVRVHGHSSLKLIDHVDECLLEDAFAEQLVELLKA